MGPYNTLGLCTFLAYLAAANNLSLWQQPVYEALNSMETCNTYRYGKNSSYGLANWHSGTVAVHFCYSPQVAGDAKDWI